MASELARRHPPVIYRPSAPSVADGGGDWKFWIGPLAIFFAGTLLAFGFTVDDAFISFRYADNLAHGHGPVFNPGEHVEGYSNPLWVLLLAPWAALGLDLVLPAKLLGIACSLLTLWLTVRIARRDYDIPRAQARFLALFLASSIPLLYYAIAGLETPLYGMLILLLLERLSAGRYGTVAVVCTALVLTRPEGLVFVAVPVVAALAGEQPKRRLALLAIPLATVVLLTVFRLSYYGQPLPNTFYAKIDSHRSLGEFLQTNSIGFAKGFAHWALTYLGAGTLAVAGLAGLWRHGRRHLPALGASLLLFAFIGYSGGDWMAFMRFYLPALPLVLLFAVAALTDLERRLPAPRRWLLGAALVIGSNLALSAYSLVHLARDDRWNPAMTSHAHVVAGHYLQRISQPGDVIVVNEIGAIGYYSRRPLVDMLGLADAHVPELLRQPDLGAYAQYMLARDPRFVLLNFERSGGVWGMHPFHQAIYDAMDHSRYRRDRVFELNTDKQLVLFVRT